MTGKSNIEWTEATWNPIVGCSIVSPGCTNCYAMKMAGRIEKMNRTGGSNSNYVNPYDGTTKRVNGNTIWTGKLARAQESTLLAPLRRKKPTVYFVNSMGDLFHEDCADDWIDEVFAIMALSPQHTFQVLTKRAKRMREWFAGDRADSVGLAMLTIVDRIPYGHRRVPWPLPNVWLGVSAERQQEADERIPLLLQTPAAVRFISAEPLLGPIDLVALGAIAPADKPMLQAGSPLCTDVNCRRGGPHYPREFGCRWGKEPKGLPGLDWVIAGGESGHGARPMHPGWARTLRDQCNVAGVAFFFKQWGGWAPSTPEQSAGNPRSGWCALRAHPRVSKAEELYPEAGAAFIEHFGKKKAGRLLDGVTHDAMPGGGS